MANIKKVSDAFWGSLVPEAPLTVSEWADRYRFLTSESAAEPGPYSTARTPYLREIMDCLSPSSPYSEIVFMKGSQVGGSECGNNWVGHTIDEGNGSMLVVQPNLDLAGDYSNQRLKSMIDSCPRIRAKVSESKGRDAGNAKFAKKYPGGWLFIGGANSPASLCSKPVGRLFLDEVDRFPYDLRGEGDPIELAKARARTFGIRTKIFTVSSPTIEGRSKIAAAYESSDKRRYHVPCPHCGEFQWLKFERLKWPVGEPKKATYKCEKCERPIEEHYKTDMLERGKWIAENPGAEDGDIAGFHISALYAPLGWFSWGQIARLFLRSCKDVVKLKSFLNTVLGEVWKEPGDAPDWKRLYKRRESYPIGTAPRGVMFLTAGIDIQKDRIEVGIDGWGYGQESWVVDYRVLEGDTATEEPWRKLDALLLEQFPRESGGTLPILRAGIDTGYNTQVVYNWIRKYPASRVMPLKGRQSMPAIISRPAAVEIKGNGQTVKSGIKVWSVGTDIAKSELYGRLRLEPSEESKKYPPGYCHFPELDEEYFKQLTAEKLSIRDVRGRRQEIWEKTRERNEALDCKVYSRAAAAGAGIDRMKFHHWKNLAFQLGEPIDEETSSGKKTEGT